MPIPLEPCIEPTSAKRALGAAVVHERTLLFSYQVPPESALPPSPTRSSFLYAAAEAALHRHCRQRVAHAAIRRQIPKQISSIRYSNNWHPRKGGLSAPTDL